MQKKTLISYDSYSIMYCSVVRPVINSRIMTRLHVEIIENLQDNGEKIDIDLLRNFILIT